MLSRAASPLTVNSITAAEVNPVHNIVPPRDGYIGVKEQGIGITGFIAIIPVPLASEPVISFNSPALLGVVS